MPLNSPDPFLSSSCVRKGRFPSHARPWPIGQQPKPPDVTPVSLSGRRGSTQVSSSKFKPPLVIDSSSSSSSRAVQAEDGFSVRQVRKANADIRGVVWGRAGGREERANPQQTQTRASRAIFKGPKRKGNVGCVVRGSWFIECRATCRSSCPWPSRP